jgi:outer membrane protein TolC
LSENLLVKTDRDIKANVASTYYTTLLLEETNSILDLSVQNLKQTLSDTKALQKAGFVEEIVSDQVRVTLSLVENSASETARMLNSTKNLLKLQLGVENDKNIELTEKLDAMMMAFAPEVGIGSKLDPQRNIDLRLVESQVKISNLQLKLEHSNFLPNLSAYVTYQKLVNEPAINFSPTALAGASLSVPIFSSGLRRSRVQQARLELEKSRNSYDQVRQSLEMELADATAQLSVAWAKYQSQKENKELAKRVYDNFSLKYSKGMASQQDLIQSNDKYLQAVGNYTSAVVELFNARIRVDKVLGNL